MKKSGFTLVEIMIVVAIIGLLAAIAIPSFVRARQTSQKNACINNLRQIDGGKDQWAIEEKQPTGASPSQANVTVYLKKWPECPAGGTYAIAAIGTDPSCNEYDATTHAATL